MAFFNRFGKGPRVSTIKIVQPEKQVIDGIKFDSKTEAQRYLVLKNRQVRGEIENLEVQPRFHLSDSFILKDKKLSEIFSNSGKERHKITGGSITSDFVYLEKGNPRVVVEDVKFRGWQKSKSQKKAALKSDWLFKVRMWLPRYQEEYELRVI